MNGLDTPRWLAAAGLVALYLAMCAAIVWRERRRHAQARRDAAALAPAADGAAPWLVAFASQTGSAEQIAWQTGRALHTAGVPARVLPLATLTAAELQAAPHALFIVSTYGEGDPPDNAALFARRVLDQPLVLAGTRHAVLALGDRAYTHFCGFGRTLDTWLQAQGATPLFDRIEVNNGDDAALRDWLQQLGHVAGIHDLIDAEPGAGNDWQTPTYSAWRLAARRHLNPGSAGAPTHHLELEPVAGPLPAWEAGDLVQVRLPADAAHPREYSVASLPADGRMHLLVRQQRRADGTLGLVSGWLTQHAALGDTLDLRLRAHRNFRLGDNAARPLVLIGNGSGLAGLRAHLKARAASRDIGPASRNWLVFGERHAAHDSYYADELAAWQANGVLERLDLVFSRDATAASSPHGARYVQDRLRERADALRSWLAAGAAVYVCGSLDGMAAGVDAALVDIAGQDGVDRLIEQGRYRRDVY